MGGGSSSQSDCASQEIVIDTVNCCMALACNDWTKIEQKRETRGTLDFGEEVYETKKKGIKNCERLSLK